RATMMRLALVLHFADPASLDMPDGLLPAVAIERAARVMRYVEGSARAFYSDLSGATSDQVVELSRFVLRHEGDTIKLRDFSRGPAFCRGPNNRQRNLDLINALVDHGWLHPTGNAFPCTTWQVNPKVRTQFAARAAEESDRARNELEMMRD